MNYISDSVKIREKNILLKDIMDSELPKLTCVCGAIVMMNSVAAHFKSRKHKLRMGEIKPVVIKQGSFVVKFQ